MQKDDLIFLLCFCREHIFLLPLNDVEGQTITLGPNKVV